MIYQRYEQLVAYAQGQEEVPACAVVLPDDPYTLQALGRAYQEKLLEPILIGERTEIVKQMESLGLECWREFEFVEVCEPERATQTAADLVRSGRACSIMKGLIKTSTFMHVLLKKENGLRTGRVASMLSIREMPHYHKLIGLTDTALCIAPDLDTKRQILENAVEAMLSMGFDPPKVAVLAAAETVSPQMPETVDAAALVQMNREGIVKNCTVDGPLSFDLAIRQDAARIKGVEGGVAGDADLLLFPDLRSANITAKAISFVSGIPVGSLILGTKIPIIISSRSSPVDTKYRCIALAAATGIKKN